MAMQIRFVITAEDEGAFFTDPKRACADLRRLLSDRAVHLAQPQILARYADKKALTYKKTDFDLAALLEGDPVDPTTVNGTEVILILLMQRGVLRQLLRD